MSRSIQRRCLSFLRVLKDTRAVVAGQTALAVLLTQSRWDSNWQDQRDLEIYAPLGSVPRLLTYLVEREGYCVGRRIKGRKEDASISDMNTDTTDTTPPNNPGENVTLAPTPQSIYGETIESTTYLARDRDNQRIVLVESSCSSALLPLTSSPATLLVNYFTSTTLVCMYPRTTFDGIAIRNPSRRRSDDETILRTYAEEDFQVKDAEHNLESCRTMTSYCPRLMRSSEDPWSFSMDFSNTTAHNPPIQRWRTRSYFPETYWTWGDWDHHAEHPNVPFVVPNCGVFSNN